MSEIASGNPVCENSGNSVNGNAGNSVDSVDTVRQNSMDPVREAFDPNQTISSLGRVHFIGIGGSGMSVLAQMLHEDGVEVSGCDREENDHTKHFRDLGVKIYIGQSASHVHDADVIVYSSAIKPTNPEIVEAFNKGVKIVHRSDILSLLLREKRGVTVAGAHGKTTTSSLLSHILTTQGVGELADPSYAIGGSIQADNGAVLDGGHAGSGSVMVAEADESDGSFEKYHPYISIVTNVEADHLDHYGNAENYRAAFVKHLSNAENHIVLCADDEGARMVLEKLPESLLSKTIVYGLAKNWPNEVSERVSDSVLFAGIEHEDEKAGSGKEVFSLKLPAKIAGGCECDCVEGDCADGGCADGGCECACVSGDSGRVDGYSGRVLPVSLMIPGLHNARNASAAIIAAILLGLDPDLAAKGASDFRGASRRFDIRGCVNNVTVVDDYAHHPTEIEALLKAARRRYPDSNIRVLFQPHLFSRTRSFAHEFAYALSFADDVIVTGIFPAREKQEDFPDIHADTIVNASHEDGLKTRIEAVEDMNEAAEILSNRAKSGDVLFTVGAGSITNMTSVMLKGLSLE